MLKMKKVSGPTSYATGGFTVTFGEFESIEDAIAVCDQSQVLEASNTAYGLRVSISGNRVTIVVSTIDVTAAAPVAWAELAAGTDLSGRTFTVIADGY